MTIRNTLDYISRSAAALLLVICATGSVLAQTPGAASARTADKPYNFSPVNQHSLELTAMYWNPILKYVSDKSGVPLNLHLGRTSAETTAKVLSGEADFSFTNHLFSPDRIKLGWTVFGRRQAPSVHGQIIVLADSPITSLAGLAGKDVAFPGPEALVAYKTTYGQLLEQKITAKPVFAGNLDAAFSQMVAGRVFAMGSNSQMTDEYAIREGRKFRVLWSSPAFNDLALMASPRVPRAQMQAVAKAFLGMHQDAQGKKILEEAAKTVNAKQPVVFVAANDEDYASYRDFYRNAPASLR
ncbi:MAG: phosphate/phosphite/phosphonate ABC transporter substrate-binding protein [Polaromonas sp.]|jgi:phosphonate transport system substrate-binding protein|nr:phosphate/phosphite/phosphonate ABC transporter substrate-binding protein [Polaromonas sp.]